MNLIWWPPRPGKGRGLFKLFNHLFAIVGWRIYRIAKRYPVQFDDGNGGKVTRLLDQAEFDSYIHYGTLPRAERAKALAAFVSKTKQI